MNGLESGQTLLEGWGETLVGLCHVAEQSVASGLGNIKRIQEGGPGRLVLVGHIAVPGDRVGSVAKEVEETLVGGTAVDQVDFRESFRGTTGKRSATNFSTLGRWLGSVVPGWVNVQSSKISSKLQGLFDGKGSEILVSECDDLLLGHQQSQLIPALVVEAGELHATDLGAD